MSVLERDIADISGDGIRRKLYVYEFIRLASVGPTDSSEFAECDMRPAATLGIVSTVRKTLRWKRIWIANPSALFSHVV